MPSASAAASTAHSVTMPPAIVIAAGTRATTAAAVIPIPVKIVAVEIVFSTASTACARNLALFRCCVEQLATRACPELELCSGGTPDGRLCAAAAVLYTAEVS